MSESRRVMLVTGSTDGIGKQIALGLAKGGAHVIVHGRSRPKVDAAIADLEEEAAGASFDGVSFDLGSLESVRKGAAQVQDRVNEHGGALHVLVCNAGIFAQERVLTSDGIEVTLAVNHVGHFLLEHLLEPQLVAAAPGRVIVLSSVAHTRGRIHTDDLSLEKGYSGYAAYAQSKLANVMFARALADKHDPKQLLAYALHPGVVATKLLRQGFGPVPGASPEHGAKTAIDLALSDPPMAESGAYFSEGLPAQPAPAAQDEAARAALWQATERLAHL
jgi:NAD(P)-dependent dehydrogenase (short-subunit alcohol dehydrogenase family)